ncbi:hypothetical protein J6590_065722 [Homalodisca vitripennis]|nr:hypothetical protein J6590_065722 [Homalodisca vitripennis]
MVLRLDTSWTRYHRQRKRTSLQEYAKYAQKKKQGCNCERWKEGNILVVPRLYSATLCTSVL